MVAIIITFRLHSKAASLFSEPVLLCISLLKLSLPCLKIHKSHVDKQRKGIEEDNMKTISHKQKARKTKLQKLQKKVRSLQMESKELRAKLLQYEVEIAAQAEQFSRSEEEYQRKIDKLKAKIRLQRKSESPILRKQMTNWIFFGIISSIFPLAINVLYIWFLGYTVTLADILADFILVLFAISMNLLSILFGARKSPMTLMYICISVLFAEFSICTSIALIPAHLDLSMSISIDKISAVFQFAAISMILEVISGTLIIVIQSRISPE